MEEKREIQCEIIFISFGIFIVDFDVKEFHLTFFDQSISHTKKKVQRNKIKLPQFKKI